VTLILDHIAILVPDCLEWVFLKKRQNRRIAMQLSRNVFAGLTLLALSSAAHAHQTPPPNDIRCFIMGTMSLSSKDSAQRNNGSVVAAYYFGKLEAFSRQEIEDAMFSEGQALTQSDFVQSETQRCSKALGERTEMMKEIGPNLIRRGNEMTKPLTSPLSPPPTPAPSPPLAHDLAAPPPAPTTALSSPPTGRTPPKQDPNYPLHLGEQYYPVESRRLGEEGTCVVRLHVGEDGYIRATQLVSSTGFERLNAACLSSFDDGRMIPATVDGKPATSWYLLKVNWKLSGSLSITPQIRDDYNLKVGPDDYPAISRKLHQEGDCVVHVTIERDGAPSSVSVTKSTGYAPLDQACLAAVQQAQFIAARLQGKMFTASTDINISWRLPSP
jgi:TonB family protein